MPTYSDSLSWLFTQTRAGAPRDPERMRRLIDLLELTQPPRSVHVVGTNGKGSVSQLIAAGLGAAGLKVGRFSSPHVEDFRERIVIAGQEISQEEVVAFAERVRRLEPSFAFFELSFALALSAFANHDVDTAVVEAGVGAAKDATLALENVCLSVLTNVSLDHQDTLGHTLAAIAQDKAAVMRSSIPFVTAEKNEGVLDILKAHAQAVNAPFYSLSTAPELFENKNKERLEGWLEPTKAPLAREFGGFTSVTTSAERLSEANPPQSPLLRGRNGIDIQNKRLARAALRLLNIEENHIEQGLKSSSPLPARQEIFRLDDKTVILDGGHNEAAVRALIERVGEADTLIFGSLAKREGKGLFELLKPHFAQIIVTSVEGDRPAWLEPNQTFIPNSLEALDTGLKTLPPNGTLLIAGSLYLAGQVRPRLRDLAQMT